MGVEGGGEEGEVEGSAGLEGKGEEVGSKVGGCWVEVGGCWVEGGRLLGGYAV